MEVLSTPRVHIRTFGCQMNEQDSGTMLQLLEGAGYSSTDDPEDADVILINTCSVREKAEHKLRSEVGRVAQLKRTRPDLILVVAGCMAQQEGDKILKSMPAVDIVIGPDNIVELPELLTQVRLGGPPVIGRAHV